VLTLRRTKMIDLWSAAGRVGVNGSAILCLSAMIIDIMWSCGYRRHLLMAVTHICFLPTTGRCFTSIKCRNSSCIVSNSLVTEYLYILLPGVPSDCFELFRVFSVSHTNAHTDIASLATLTDVLVLLTLAVSVGFACVYDCTEYYWRALSA